MNEMPLFKENTQVFQKIFPNLDEKSKRIFAGILTIYYGNIFMVWKNFLIKDSSSLTSALALAKFMYASRGAESIIPAAPSPW